MKLKYFVAALTVGAASSAYASAVEEERFQTLTEDGDSLKMLELGEAVVKAVKAPDNAPFAVTKIDRKTLSAFAKSGRELPFLFARTPGIMAWSENGLGTGTTYMRLRGAGGSRINVTLDGVSLNSPEDQCVFWANMNSYAALLDNVERALSISVFKDSFTSPLSALGESSLGRTSSRLLSSPSTNGASTET